jgi:hypothetical protein
MPRSPLCLGVHHMLWGPEQEEAETMTTHDEETIAVLQRIRQAAEHLAEQQTYAYVPAPNLVPDRPGPRPDPVGGHYRGIVRITRATGAVAALEQRDDGRFAWRPLPMEAGAV